EALCNRRRGEARERDPREDRAGEGDQMTDETSSSEESLARAEQLLARLEATRAELERLSESGDADKALGILTDLADPSRPLEEELQRAKRAAESDAQA